MLSIFIKFTKKQRTFNFVINLAKLKNHQSFMNKWKKSPFWVANFCTNGTKTKCAKFGPDRTKSLKV